MKVGARWKARLAEKDGELVEWMKGVGSSSSFEPEMHPYQRHRKCWGFQGV